MVTLTRFYCRFNHLNMPTIHEETYCILHIFKSISFFPKHVHKSKTQTHRRSHFFIFFCALSSQAVLFHRTFSHHLYHPASLSHWLTATVDYQSQYLCAWIINPLCLHLHPLTQVLAWRLVYELHHVFIA